MARTRWPPISRTLASSPGQADQERHRRWVPRTWDPGRQIESKDNQRRQPISRSGRDPGLRRYSPSRSNRGRQAGTINPHPPCRLRARSLSGALPTSMARDGPLWRVFGLRLGRPARGGGCAVAWARAARVLFRSHDAPRHARNPDLAVLLERAHLRNGVCPKSAPAPVRRIHRHGWWPNVDHRNLPAGHHSHSPRRQARPDGSLNALPVAVPARRYGYDHRVT
jgi:hypothetical protein